MSRPKDANFLEGGQDYFLDMFVLVWPSSRSWQLSTEVEMSAEKAEWADGTPHPAHSVGCIRRSDLSHTSPFPTFDDWV